MQDAPGGGTPERDEHADAPPAGRVRPDRRLWYLLLIVPFVATLVPPFYARENPHLAAWPFFYWWQFAWILVTALIVYGVYWATTYHGRARGGRRDEHGGSR